MICIRVLAVCCHCAFLLKAVQALAPANPHGWQETQPDGTPVGKLFLKGRPDREAVYIVDQHQHPVVVDENGWYVYGSSSAHSETTTEASLRAGRPTKPGDLRPTIEEDVAQSKNMTTIVPIGQHWHPTEYRVSPDSKPPRHLRSEVLARSFPNVAVDAPDVDFLCEGEPPSPWCPYNPPLIGRSVNAPITRGVNKVIVILVRFSDHTDRQMPSKQDIEFLFTGQGTDDPRAPTGTMRDFFRIQSLGKYSVEAYVEDWIDAKETEEFYSFENFGLTNQFAQAAYGALDRMDERGIDWTQFDDDKNGILDSVVIFHSGYVAEGGGIDCNNDKSHGTHRIWSHATTVPDNQNTWYSNDRTVRIGRYSTTSAIFGTCGSDLQRIGVIGHEMLHMLGVPDMLGKPGTGVGVFDVMGMMWGSDGSLYYPGLTSAWTRHKLGWSDATKITSSGKYTIGTAQLYEDVYRIDLADGEYLLIENRQKRLYDEKLPGDGGLLIWHIDDNMVNDWMSRPGWPGEADWPGNGNHYQLALLSPDGRFDSEHGKNFGDTYDFWTNQTTLEPGPGRQTAIDSEFAMYPNTDTYSGGIVSRTGIRIYDISELGEKMTFRVDVPGTPTEPPSTASPTVRPTGTPTETATASPTSHPTLEPTEAVTATPTDSPTPKPTVTPTESLTASPTYSPTASPSYSPTSTPTTEPSNAPTESALPSNGPTTSPQPSKSAMPSNGPTTSLQPSDVPSSMPSSAPSESGEPSFVPTVSLKPSGSPSDAPTLKPSNRPSEMPSQIPSDSPSEPASSFESSEAPSDGPMESDRRPTTVDAGAGGYYTYDGEKWVIKRNPLNAGF